MMIHQRRALLAGITIGLTATMAASAQSKTFDLSFKGGTAAEYIASVRTAAGQANIVTSPEVDLVPMPAVDLRDVTVDSALWLLDGRSHVGADQQVALGVSRSAFGGAPEAGAVVFSVQAAVHGVRPVKNTVVSVAELLQHEIPAADVLSAMEAALDVTSAEHAPAELRFHEATGLVIARGHPEQVSAVHEVLENLQRTVRARNASDDRDRSVMELQEKHASANKQNHQMQAEIKELTRALVETQTRAEFLMRELDETRQRLLMREAEISELNMEVQQMREALVRRAKQP